MRMAEKLQIEVLRHAADECFDSLEIVVHNSIDSTNNWCLSEVKNGRQSPFACFAEQQTAGRGRRGKQWLTPACSGVAMSLCWMLKLLPRQAGLLPLSIAVGICEILEAVGIMQVQVKWPNDVYIRGRKIAGILIETRPLHNQGVYVVIGVGLNYDLPLVKQAELTSQTVVAVTDFITEQSLLNGIVSSSRTDIAAALLKKLVYLCENIEQESKRCLNKFRQKYDFCYQNKVDILLDNGGSLTGVAQGVADSGELLVSINGKCLQFNSGEVSIRKRLPMDVAGGRL